MRRLAAVLSLTAALTACDSDPLTDLRVDGLSHDPAELVGTWDLITETTPGDLEPPVTVPARFSETYVFAADGSAEVRYQDDPTVRTMYRVEGVTLYVGERALYFGIDGDRLYVDHRPVDGPLYEYARR